MDHVVIVIVHYNSQKDSLDCLESLRDIKTPDFKSSIVLIDNGSLKNFILPKAYKNNNVELIRSESNLGFTGGNNLGITYAREKFDPDYFLLLNNDTRVDTDFLNQLYKRAKREKSSCLICPKIYFEKGYEYHAMSYSPRERGKVFWYAGGSIDWPNLTAHHRGVDEIDRGHFDNQKLSDFCTGCCLLIPRRAIETVGLLDKSYFLYLEDVDYSLRAKEAGFKLCFEPKSIIWHKNAGSSGGAGSGISVYYQSRNRLFFAIKHGSLKTKFTALRILLQNLISKNKYERKASFDLIFARMGKQPII
ncbi:MAG: glycosyltransferase family 2 protein [Patescibacteria group bacterium]